MRPRDVRRCRRHPGEADIGDGDPVMREEDLEGAPTASVGLWGGSGWAPQPSSLVRRAIVNNNRFQSLISNGITGTVTVIESSEAVLYSSLPCKGNQGLERFSDLLEATQPVAEPGSEASLAP